ncbi:MAG: glycosyltransferase [bacterium]|nr:glycosyltransferase [bacterium]
MRVAFLDSLYPQVARQVYGATADLADQPWHAQRDRLLDARFGCWDSYAAACRYHGAESEEILLGVPALTAAMERDHAWDAVCADAIVVMRVPTSVDAGDVQGFRSRGAKAVVAMVSSEAPSDDQLRAYDLVVTAFPHYARAMKERGLRVEYLPLAFDPRRLGLAVDGSGTESDAFMAGAARPWAARTFPATFVGGLGIARHWQAGQHAVCAVAEQVPEFRWWGYQGPDKIPLPLVNSWQGEAWGDDYFGVLGASKVALNRHGEVHTAPRGDGTGRKWYTCNMRTFEAPGMGAVLVTETSANLAALYTPWEECVPFGNPREAALNVRWLLDHDDRAQAIAAAGQRRTLASHTYRHRCAILLDLLEALA